MIFQIGYLDKLNPKKNPTPLNQITRLNLVASSCNSAGTNNSLLLINNDAQEYNLSQMCVFFPHIIKGLLLHIM